MPDLSFPVLVEPKAQIHMKTFSVASRLVIFFFFLIHVLPKISAEVAVS